MSKSTSLIPAQELARLKEQVLYAVLNNQTLPGSNNRLAFADLPFVLTQPDIYLVDNEIKNSIHIEKINKQVQVVSEDFLRRQNTGPGKIIYFQFQTTESGNDNLWLSLDAKVLSAGAQQADNLTSMQMKFQKVQNEWRIMDEPTTLSA